MRSTSLLILLHFAAVAAHAEEWPKSYTQLDALLCVRSSRYRAMADAVRQRQPYRIISATDFAGNVREGDGELIIELDPRLTKERRVTVLIWEMANAYQRQTFSLVTRKAVTGEIPDRREYGIRMELVEYGSHQLHRDVLEDLSRGGDTISEEFLYFVAPKAKSLAEYRIPSAHDYIEAQAKSGHTKHYEDWYDRLNKVRSSGENAQGDANR